MENSVPVHQNGIEMLRTGTVKTSELTTELIFYLFNVQFSVQGGTKVTPVTSSLKSCSVSVSHLVIPEGSDLLTTTTDSASR